VKASQYPSFIGITVGYTVLKQNWIKSGRYEEKAGQSRGCNLGEHPAPPEPHEVSAAWILARHYNCAIEFLKLWMATSTRHQIL